MHLNDIRLAQIRAVNGVVLKEKPLPIGKREEFFALREKWAEFRDYNFFKFIQQELPSPTSLASPPFSCYNPGQKLAVVSLYTPEIGAYAIESEKNIKSYCEKQGYTFYVYRRSLDPASHGNWSKPKALLNHIEDHAALIWMDSDTLIFNPEKKFEDILARCVGNKKVIACEDIGTNNTHLAKGSAFNSGVVIFRRHQYTQNLLRRWWEFRKENDTSSLYSSGGDQEVLVNILKKSDPAGHNSKIFPMNTFNTDPRLVDQDTFIIHFMAYPSALKQIFMKYWNS